MACQADGEMRDAGYVQEPPIERHGLFLILDFDDRSARVRSHTPDVQIGDLHASQRFDTFAKRRFCILVGGIEEHGRGIAHERPRPAPDDDRADNSHNRIHPGKAKIASREQCGDREHRRQRVGEDVEIGRAQVVVMPMVVMIMMAVAARVVRFAVMMMAMIMIVTAHEQEADTADIVTNLVINTNRRTYHLELRATPSTYMAGVSWSYPHDELVALRAAEAERERAAPLASGISYAALNFAYRIKGDKAPWRPVRVFDDGRQLFVEFGDGIANREMPPLFVLGENGKAELVNYRVDSRFMIVDRLFERGELRLGAGRNARSVRIERLPSRNRGGK